MGSHAHATLRSKVLRRCCVWFYMLGRRRAWLRLRSRGMCAAGLWTKLHKRRPCVRGLFNSRMSRNGRPALKNTMTSDSVEDMDVETTAPSSALFSSSPSSSSSPPSKKADIACEDIPIPDASGASDAAPDVETGAEGEQAQEPVAETLPPVPKEKTKRQIVMLPSVFEGRPPVVFFSYTQACSAPQRPMERAVYADIDGPRIFYSHTDAVHEYNAVINIMRQGGLYRVKADTGRYLLLWGHHPSADQLKQLKPKQRTNHFPGSWHLGRKDALWKNISRVQKKFGRCYTITPQGYVFPKAFGSWDAARIRQPEALWIWKPCSQSCGRGIRCFSSDISPEEARELARKRGIVQRYIPNPLLIEGYKFDLRIYVVVVSYDPLKVHINDEGLVRLATMKYTDDPTTLENRMMHLTNYSVNKLSTHFVQNKDGKEQDIKRRGEAKARPASAEPAQASSAPEAPEVEVEMKGDEEAGHDGVPASKWSLEELKVNFAERGLDYDLMFSRMKDVIIKTLIAVEPSIQTEWAKALDDPEAGWLARGPMGAHSDSTSSCFELYGFDILVDSELKPWLLEVNICPSLSSGSPLDKRIKTKVVADMMTLVGFQLPPSVYRRTGGSIKRPASEVIGMACDEAYDDAGTPLSADELAKRAAKLADCDNPLDAIGLFDELAWEIVLEAHDQDMRSGGLERIFPTAQASRYVPYFEEESYCNLVLRKWYEAGGGEAVFSPDSKVPLPPWVPRQVCFEST